MSEKAFRIAERLAAPKRAQLAVDVDSLEAMAVRLVAMHVAVKHAAEKALDDACVLIEEDARGQIGQYQPQVGEYPEWAPLAESTEVEKARLGAPPEAPLLRFGELQDSFSHKVEGLEAVVGSTDPVMEFHEFGTPRMPPRPVMGPALFKNRDRVQELLGRALVDAIIGGEIASSSWAGEHADHFGGAIR